MGGVKCKEINYLDGMLHGKYDEWYWNGQKRNDSNFANGKMYGKCFWYSKDGGIYEEFD